MNRPAIARDPAHAAPSAAWPDGAPQRPERVIIATLNRLDGVTGVHAHTRTLSQGLESIGIECEVVTPFSGSRLWTLAFAVRPLLLKRFFPTWATLWYRYWHAAALRAKLRRALRRRPVHHLIAQCPPSARAAMDVRHELGLVGNISVTMVCHFNESEADEYRNQGALRGAAYGRVKAEEEAVLREVDRVVYVSSWARDLVETHRGIRTIASQVIWNGVPEQASVAPIDRREIGLQDDDFVLMNLGTLEPRKDQMGLLRLFARLVPLRPQARLVLVGEGPQRPQIEKLADELRIADKIKLLGHRRDVAALLQTADLYVHFATAENCPISVIEVARAGLAWAAKPAGGVRELLTALSGVELPGESDEENVGVLADLCSDAARRRMLGDAARQQFQEQFTQTAMVRAYATILGTGSPARSVR